MNELISLLQKFDRPLPRYTSYPTAPEWQELSSEHYVHTLLKIPESEPLSLYFHLPFCQSMCLFCGCSVILNRDPAKETVYIDHLIREIQIIHSLIGRRQRVSQLHFGGGTPTKLEIRELERLFKAIDQHFFIEPSAEVAIEIDPRTVFADQGAKLEQLKQLGFNRVSFGVQDTNPLVQAAVRRKQSLEMTDFTFNKAKSLGFDSINIDLIYGLPYQTVSTFETTIQEILQLRPDRIALFSYAKVPWLKPHQNALKEEWMPSVEEKFKIYSNARTTCHQKGYINIGMDHFALEKDELAEAYHHKRLQRNFQGYTVKRAEHHLGLGVTSIGYAMEAYFQNSKTLESYYGALQKNQLPVFRGKILTPEDIQCKWIIHELMCNFSLNFDEFEKRFHVSFKDKYSEELLMLSPYVEEGFLKVDPQEIKIYSLGELFIRNIASTFDQYLKITKERQFSRSI